jgi:hypothetical protein
VAEEKTCSLSKEMTPVSPRATHSTAPNWEEGRGSGKRKEFLLRKVVDVVDKSLSDLGEEQRIINTTEHPPLDLNVRSVTPSDLWMRRRADK